MRLLDTETMRLTLFDREPFPKYAILSHRWGDEEVSFQELESGLATQKDGYQKITMFCAEARRRGFKWCWVDTCGIDKTSSTELSEAVNSMFQWYEDSAVCFAYLADVTAQIQPNGLVRSQGFDRSCWFTRGWTLQELIAPCSVEFYSSEWAYIGNKHEMTKELSVITGVDEGVLLGTTPVRATSVAMTMSWASTRATTRREDIAYCLLGLFGINMSLLYGEGDRAFIRLQEEILKKSSDQSLFAWNPLSSSASHPTASKDDSFCGIFSPSPACFAETGDIMPLPGYWDTESTLTNRGVRLRLPLKYDDSHKIFIGILCCASRSGVKDVAIELHSFSNALEDHDHLMRRSTRVRYGNWSDDRQVQFNIVYLATDRSLWHTRYFGPRFLKTELEFHVLLDDPYNFSSLDGPLASHPPGGLIDESSVILKDATMTKRIAVLNPLKTNYNAVALLLPTTFSRNIALVFGFNSLQSGFPDVQHPWKTIALVSQDVPLEDVFCDTMKLSPNSGREVTEVKLDGVQISVDVVQHSWWAKTSRNILVSFSRIVDEELVQTQPRQLGQRLHDAGNDIHEVCIPYQPSVAPDLEIDKAQSGVLQWGYDGEDIGTALRWAKLLLPPISDSRNLSSSSGEKETTSHT